MATGGNEKAPLLINTDDDIAEGSLPSAYSREAALTLPNDRTRGVSSLSAGKPRDEQVNDSATTASASASSATATELSQAAGYAARQMLVQDHIVAIFVVAFDTHRGMYHRQNL